MKKLIALFFSLAIGATALADDYTLYIVANSTTSHALKQVQKLTFENGNVVVHYKDGTQQSTAISLVSRMYFGLGAAYTTEDVNHDGSVDTQDVLAVYEFIQSQTEDSVVTTEDVNHDGNVDTQDVLQIYEAIQGN